MAADGRDSGPVPSLKRERDEDPVSTPQRTSNYHTPSSAIPFTGPNFKPSPTKSTTSSSGLSDAPSSVSPANAFSSLDGSAPPPPKKPKLTFAEKELEKQRKAQEKLERDQAKSRLLAEKDENKRKAEAEREAKRIKIETEREEKRIVQEAEKAAKLEKKRQQEAEKAAKEEAKRKKERSQMTLPSMFFAKPTIKKEDTEKNLTTLEPGKSEKIVTLNKQKEERSEYEKRFPSFFLHDHVTLAKNNKWERDAARLEFVGKTIDKVLESWKDDSTPQPIVSGSTKRAFDAEELFSLRNDYKERGRIPKPVRDIMTELNKPMSLSLDSQNTQVKHTRNLLSTIPCKFLQFHEDVRPPYMGTFTRPLVPGAVTRLAQNPLRKELPDIDYDYDSEAEWVDEPGDDLAGEDPDSEAEDEDGQDEMDDFLDNSNQDELEKNQAMVMEPISTGLQWEDSLGRNLNQDGLINMEVSRYTFEVIRRPDDPTTILPIDPWSTAYWPQDPSPTATPAVGLMNPPRLPLNISKNTTINMAGSTLKTGEVAKSKSTTASAAAKEKKLISASEMPRFQELVLSDEYNEFTKGGLIDVLYTKFDKKETKVAIKNTLEAFATHDKAQGKWVLIDNI